MHLFYLIKLTTILYSRKRAIFIGRLRYHSSAVLTHNLTQFCHINNWVKSYF